MHYISIDWFPSAIALCTTCTVLVGLRVSARVARSIAIRRTRRAIDRALEKQS